MSGNLWFEPQMWSPRQDGAALTNTVTATSILNVNERWQKPNNFADKLGKRFWGIVHGRMSTVITTPGTLTLDFMIGAIAAFSTGAVSLNIVSKVNVPWVWEFYLEYAVLGSAAALQGWSRLTSEAIIGSPLPTVGGNGVLLLPSGTPANGTAFDDTASVITDIRATWSVANAGNSIQKTSYILTVPN